MDGDIRVAAHDLFMGHLKSAGGGYYSLDQVVQRTRAPHVSRAKTPHASMCSQIEHFAFLLTGAVAVMRVGHGDHVARGIAHGEAFRLGLQAVTVGDKNSSDRHVAITSCPREISSAS